MQLRTACGRLAVVSGFVLIGIGAYFIAFRPPLLPEDLRFKGVDPHRLREAVPGLARWLHWVFIVMGGFVAATGLLIAYLAIASQRIRIAGASTVLGVAAAMSVGLMAVVNLIIDSDFKWPLLSLAVLLGAALIGRSLGSQQMSLPD